MDVYQAIQTRHTIREFSPQALEPALIEKLVGAAFAAPSNNHLREWHFILLNDKAHRKEILDRVIHPLDRKGSLAVVNRWGMTEARQRQMYVEAIPLQYSMLMDAGALLLPFFAQPSALLKPRTLSNLNSFASIWCCIENLLIAAASEGIFGVTRIPAEEERQTVKEALHVPTGFEFPCWVALGYPAPQARRAEQLPIDIAGRIHSEFWPA